MNNDMIKMACIDCGKILITNSLVVFRKWPDGWRCKTCSDKKYQVGDKKYFNAEHNVMLKGKSGP